MLSTTTPDNCKKTDYDDLLSLDDRLKAQFHPFGFAGVYYCFQMASSFLIGCYQIVGFPEFLASRQLMSKRQVIASVAWRSSQPGRARK